MFLLLLTLFANERSPSPAPGDGVEAPASDEKRPSADAEGGGSAEADPSADAPAEEEDELDFLTSPLTAEQRRKLELRLRNPLSPLFRLGILNNLTFGAGPNDDGFNYLLRLQPTVPANVGKKVRLIARATLDVAYRGAIEPGGDDEWGLGDTATVLYLVPRWKLPVNIGFGTSFVFPTATSETLGTGKWSAGPAFGLIGEFNNFIFGFEAIHLWSFADEGSGRREDVNQTLLRPFAAYVFRTSLAVQLAATTAYDWEREQWSVPLSVGLSRIFSIGKLPIDLGVSGTYFAAGREFGPDWGLGISATIAFR